MDSAGRSRFLLDANGPHRQTLAVKRQRVYVDTSVVGGCFDDEFQTWSKGLFSDFRDSRFLPVVSELTSAEIEEAPEAVRNQYGALLAMEHEYLELSEEAVALASSYLEAGILSDNFYNDAMHIALASIAEVDMLVSWNFKHVVHYDKIRRFNAVNLSSGYKTIEIYSPREVTFHETE